MSFRPGLITPRTIAGGGGGVTIANFFLIPRNTTTTPKTQAITWGVGDIVAFIGGSENALTTLNTPTLTGETFTPRASVTAGGGNECTAYAWSTAPSAAGGSANFSASRSANVLQWGGYLWIISGAASTGPSFANQTEAATNLVGVAGGIVVHGYFDWNANATNQNPATGSGTATERDDGVSGSAYGYGANNWENVSAGSVAYGLASYAGLVVAQAAMHFNP